MAALWYFCRIQGFCKMTRARSFWLRSELFKRYSQQNTKLYSLLGLNGAGSLTRLSLCLHSRRYAAGIGGPAPGQIELQGEDAEANTQNEPKETRSNWSPTLFKMFESAATTFASILVLGMAGYGYPRVCIFLEEDIPVSDCCQCLFELSRYSTIYLRKSC